MAEQLFEVAFSGKIMEGANPDEVKARVGKIFNADAAMLAQLFSGKRVTIKKNIDKATAAKYKTALNRAGAQCEVKLMGGGEAAPAAAQKPAAPAAQKPAAPAAQKPAAAAAPAPAASAEGPVSMEYETKYDGEVAPPPQTDPLGITGDQIEDLSASLAPPGSELQDGYDITEAPSIDTDGIDVAPPGSDLSTGKKQPDPPPPNTTGIELAD
jgi:hypothetical protein